jgi:hypothetical protein
MGFGYFADPETLRPLPNTDTSVAAYVGCCRYTKDVIIASPLVYVAPDGRVICAPIGYRTNGITVSRFLWRLVWPYEAKTREASFIHDWLYSTKLYPRKYADQIFYYAMRANRCGWFHARLRWLGTRLGGRFYWKKATVQGDLQ